MPKKEKLLAGAFLGSLGLALLLGGYNYTVVLELGGRDETVVRGVALILGSVLCGFGSTILWCACRQSVVRDELQTFEPETKSEKSSD